MGIDFGTSNTVVACWDEGRHRGVPLALPEYGRMYAPAPPEHAFEPIPIVPSLIHYDTQHQWIGNQVLTRNLYSSPRTFRWMKRYIANRSPRTQRIDGRVVSHWDAGRDFLSAVFALTRAELNISHEEEIALSVPVEAFEHFADWLIQSAQQAGLRRVRLIDEPSAAALGYGIPIQPGDVYLVFDFGGGTLDVSIVRIESVESDIRGRRCRVLGKAGTELGGMTIDMWLYQEVLRLNGRQEHDEEVREMSRLLLVECERVKETLSCRERAVLSVMHPRTGTLIEAEFTRSAFEALLDRHDAFAEIDRTLRRALNDARERGYTDEMIKAVLMVGGSSLIPSVQRTLQRIFGRERVYLQHPIDAVACGAAAFVAGMDFYDHIQHDYAIRHRNMRTGDYDYTVIVPRGTPYPTPEPVRRLIIKATYDGQTRMGIDIFEVSDSHRPCDSPLMELVFDPAGAARLTPVTPDAQQERSYFWMNEQTPTFLQAEPPAQRGEACFEVLFSVDANKRLLITVRDLRTMRLVMKDYPVVKLT